MFLLLIVAALALVLAAFGVDLTVILAILLIVVAIMFIPAVAGALGALFPGTLIAGVVGAGSWWVAGLAIVAAYMVSPETVSKIVESAGEIAEIVVDEVVDVGGNTISAILSNPLVLGAGALALYFIFGDDSDSSDNANTNRVNNNPVSTDYYYNEDDMYFGGQG